jgi:hypothetical protein
MKNSILIFLIPQIIWLILFVAALMIIPDTSLFEDKIATSLVYLGVTSALALLSLPFYYDLD